MKLSYSVAEACKLLSLGRSTLYAKIKSGDLKVIKVGRRTLLTTDSIHAWILGLPNGPTPNASSSTKGGRHEA